jgi:hypothetical protein
VITEFYFFSTGSTKSYVLGSSSEEIKLTPDQNQYNPGDTATILLESPLPKGYYLITVEREGIFTEELRYIDSNVTTLEIPIARNYIPVCYVSVASYSVRTEEPSHQFGETDLDKPKGYYGATKLYVNTLIEAKDYSYVTYNGQTYQGTEFENKLYHYNNNGVYASLNGSSKMAGYPSAISVKEGDNVILSVFVSATLGYVFTNDEGAVIKDSTGVSMPQRAYQPLDFFTYNVQ